MDNTIYDICIKDSCLIIYIKTWDQKIRQIIFSNYYAFKEKNSIGREIGDILIQTNSILLEELKEFREIKEVRGCGLMIGMEFDQPVKEIRNRLIHEQKVFTGASGTNVIRLLPPLCLSKAEADEFLVRLRKVLG